MPTPSAGYVTSINVAPSIFVAGTVYAAIKNTGTGVIAIGEITAQMLFTGTAAATRSIFAVDRCSGTPVGTAAAVVHITDPIPNANATIVSSATGVTGLTIDGIERFWHFGIPSQLAAPLIVSRAFKDEALFVLPPGKCLAIVAHTAIVVGTLVSINIILYEAK